MKPIKKALLLHDLCGVGKAALTNMLPVMGVAGIEACPVPTMLLSTHTGGYGSPEILRGMQDYIRACADHYVREKIIFDCIFIGYPGSSEVMEAICYLISCFPDIPVILDPIMGDGGNYYSNFDAGYGNIMKQMAGKAGLLIPNLTEACILTGEDYGSCTKADMQRLCGKLHGLGPGKVIITSVPVGEGKKGIAVSDKSGYQLLEFEAMPHDFHGTGDIFDGVLTASLLKGSSLSEAAQKAHKAVYLCLEESLKFDYEEREGILLEPVLGKIAAMFV